LPVPTPFYTRPLPPPRPPEIPLSKRMERDFEARLAHPRVSVVLVNKDGVDSLWHCLFALKTQTYVPEEVILVDLASKDASLAFVRDNYPRVKVLECPGDFSQTLAANLGVRTAQGELVALLSPEAVPTPEWLSRLVEEFRRSWPGTGALTSRVGRGKEEVQAAEVLNLLGRGVEGYLEDPVEAFHPEMGSILFARHLAPEGPFDEDHQAFQEDAYLGWKLRSLGKGVRRCRTAKAYLREEGGASRWPAWRASYLGLRNRWLNLFLFYEGRTLLRVLPWMALEALVLLVRGLGSLRLFLGVLFAVGWILLHPGPVLQKRGTLQGKRKVGDRALLAHLSGRVLPDGSFLSRPVNFISLAYCSLVGLPVLESSADRTDRSDPESAF